MTISEFIAKDLRGRIRSGDALPENLTLPGLAQFYSVSLTPVRTAVAELIEDDIIRKEPNGRLAIPTSVRRAPVEPPVEPAERPPDWTSIVQQDAIRESLRGESQKWKINETAERYGIGRAVVQSIFQASCRHGGFWNTNHVAAGACVHFTKTILTRIWKFAFYLN